MCVYKGSPYLSYMYWETEGSVLCISVAFSIRKKRNNFSTDLGNGQLPRGFHQS